MEANELVAKMSDLQCLVNEIESQRSWQVALSQIKDSIEALDDNWQAVEKDKFYEMQITKIGLLTVLNLVDEWKEELAELQEQHEAMENPDKIQLGDYDNEIIGDNNGN